MLFLALLQTTLYRISLFLFTLLFLQLSQLFLSLLLFFLSTLLLLAQLLHPPLPFCFLVNNVLHFLFVFFFGKYLFELYTQPLFCFTVFSPYLLIQIVYLFLHLLSFYSVFMLLHLLVSHFGCVLCFLRQLGWVLGESNITSGMSIMPF